MYTDSKTFTVQLYSYLREILNCLHLPFLRAFQLLQMQPEGRRREVWGPFQLRSGERPREPYTAGHMHLILRQVDTQRQNR